MTAITLRDASADDLAAINRVVEAAFMTWQLPERVKRLSLPGYLYQPIDLEHLTVKVALVDDDDRVQGVAAWEAAATAGLPAGQQGLLLHGLYVDPPAMGQGIGSQLLAAAREAARAQGLAGVLVKAQADAEGFFRRRGLRRLPPEDAARHYARRYWWPVSSDS